jgi:hypothetical protein
MRKTIFRIALITIAALLAGIAPAAAQTGTIVRVDPAYKLVRQGDEFVLTIQIDDVVNLYAFDVRVSFPPDKLEVVSASNGDFLEEPFLGLIEWDNEDGTVTAIVSQEYPAEPKSGSGALVTVNLRAKTEANGYAELMLTSVELSDNDGLPIFCSLQDGRVHIGAYPLYLPLVLR